MPAVSQETALMNDMEADWDDALRQFELFNGGNPDVPTSAIVPAIDAAEPAFVPETALMNDIDFDWDEALRQFKPVHRRECWCPHVCGSSGRRCGRRCICSRDGPNL